MTDRVCLEEPVLEEIDQLFKLEGEEVRFVSFEERDGEAEQCFDAFGKDEVEHGRDQLERQAVAVRTSRGNQFPGILRLWSSQEIKRRTRITSRTTDSHTCCS